LEVERPVYENHDETRKIPILFCEGVGNFKNTDLERRYKLLEEAYVLYPFQEERPM